VEGDEFSLQFDLVERHPAPDDLFWPWNFNIQGGVVTGLAIDSLIDLHDRVVASKPLDGAPIDVVVNDGISGG
jgi:predicted lipid carrier protein YhbT